jgi:catalase
MPKDAKERLIKNIVGSLKEVPKRIQELQIQHFYKADPGYGMVPAWPKAWDWTSSRSQPR